MGGIASNIMLDSLALRLSCTLELSKGSLSVLLETLPVLAIIPLVDDAVEEERLRLGLLGATVICL